MNDRRIGGRKRKIRGTRKDGRKLHFITVSKYWEKEVKAETVMNDRRIGRRKRKIRGTRKDGRKLRFITEYSKHRQTCLLSNGTRASTAVDTRPTNFS